MSSENANVTVDVRTITPRDRHPTIFTTFESLAPGEFLLLINDHEPAPLRYQFEAERPDEFTWEYVEQGPEVWRVHIARKAA